MDRVSDEYKNVLAARIDRSNELADHLTGFFWNLDAKKKNPATTPDAVFMKDGSFRLTRELTLCQKIFSTTTPADFVTVLSQSWDTDTHGRDVINHLIAEMGQEKVLNREYDYAIGMLKKKQELATHFKAHFVDQLSPIVETIKKMNFIVRFFAVVFYYGSEIRSLAAAIAGLDKIDARLTTDITDLEANKPPDFPLDRDDDCARFVVNVLPTDGDGPSNRNIAIQSGRRAFLAFLFSEILTIFNNNLTIRSLNGANEKDAPWIKKEIGNFNKAVIRFFSEHYPSETLPLIAHELEAYKDNTKDAISPELLSKLIVRMETAHQLTSKQDALDALVASGYDQHLDEKTINDLADFLLTQKIFFAQDDSATKTDLRLTDAQKASLNEAFVHHINQGFFERLIRGTELRSDVRAEFASPESIAIAYTDSHDEALPQKVDFKEALILVKKLGYYSNTAVGRQFAQYLVDQGFELTYFASLLTDAKLEALAKNRDVVMQERARLSSLLFNFMVDRERETNWGRNGSAVFQVAMERENRLASKGNPEAILPTPEEFDAFLKASNTVQKSAAPTSTCITSQPKGGQEPPKKTVAQAQQAIACSEAAQRQQLKHQDNFIIGFFRQVMVV